MIKMTTVAGNVDIFPIAARPKSLHYLNTLHFDIQTPFYASTSERIIAKVKSGSWSFKASCWSSVSDHAKDLIKGLLQASYF